MINQGTLAASLGPSSSGQSVTSTWFPGAHEITQGWGPAAYNGEPAGHGYAHWHAGVDIGLPCGTDIHMPAGMLGTARYVDNPGGYGTALRIEMYVYAPAGRGLVRKRTVDIWLGHLRQRLVGDGQELSGGEHLAVSNNTGNSTGCHLHFETRPAGARYGTDIDPTSWLIVGNADASQPGSSSGNPLADALGITDLEKQLSAGITSAENTLLGVAQTGMGAGLLLGGLAIVAWGMRGKNLGQLAKDARVTMTRPSKARPSSGPPAETGTPTAAPEPASEARLSRVRVTHQRELNRLSPDAQAAVHAARYGRGSKLSPAVKAELRGAEGSRFRLSQRAPARVPARRTA